MEWQNTIVARINHFTKKRHQFEAKELHAALNTILRLVPPDDFAETPSTCNEEWISVLLNFCHFLGEKGYKINGYDDSQLLNVIKQFTPSEGGKGNSEVEKMKDLLSRIIGCMALQRAGRFDLDEEAKSFT